MSGADQPMDAARLLRRWARSTPDAVALRFEDEHWTWTELLERVRHLAGARYR